LKSRHLKENNFKENKITEKLKKKIIKVKTSVNEIKFKKPYENNKLIILSILTSAPITAIFLSFIFSFYSPYGTGEMSKILSFIIGFLMFSFFPGIAILYFSKKGKVDIELSQRKSRTKFYIIGIAFQIIAAVIYYHFSNKLMFITAIAYALASAILMVINFKWKISAHTSGIAGPVTALITVYGNIALPLYLLLIPVFILRYKVKAHNIWQLIGGTIVGITVTYLIYNFML